LSFQNNIIGRLKKSPFALHAACAFLDDFFDRIDDEVQSTPGSDIGDGPPLASYEVYFGTHIRNGLNQHQAALLAEMLVHRTHIPSKDTVNGHSQSCCFAVHRPAAADHEVRVPDQIQPVQCEVRNNGFVVVKPFGPLASD
jgi:hypothetical protein